MNSQNSWAFCPKQAQSLILNCKETNSHPKESGYDPSNLFKSFLGIILTSNTAAEESTSGDKLK